MIIVAARDCGNGRVMRHWLNLSWRIAATGLAFSCFGLGGLCLTLVVFPCMQLVVRQKTRRIRLARLVIHHAFRGFIALMRILGLIDYHIEGRERLARDGLLILANHPTLIDVVFLISLIPNADCVVRNGLARNLFTRGPIRAAGYITNDSGPELIAHCAASLRAGGNLVIFPEGTRTPLDGGMKLQRGAANIAIRCPNDITPIRIGCQPRGLAKGTPWWKVQSCALRFEIKVCDDIAVNPFIESMKNEPALAARRLTQYLHHYFSLENPIYAGA